MPPNKNVSDTQLLKSLKNEREPIPHTVVEPDTKEGKIHTLKTKVLKALGLIKHRGKSLLRLRSLLDYLAENIVNKLKSYAVTYELPILRL